MSTARNPQPHADEDDYFAETRMSFGDHIEELRTHLLRAIAGFLIAFVVSLFFGKTMLRFISAPIEEQLLEFYNHRVDLVKQGLKDDPSIQKKNEPVVTEVELSASTLRAWGMRLPADALTGDGEWVKIQQRIHPLDQVFATHQAQQLVGRRPVLTTLNVQEAFVVYIKVCLVTGFVIGSPWVFYQIWSFIAAGLYPHEKRYVNVYLPFSITLFFLGVLICQFLVMPRAVEALLWFNEWLNMEPDMRLNEWLGFAIMMPVIFGLSFQTPLIMLFLERLGIFRVEQYRAYRRIAWFLLAVAGAIFTPSTDPYSMLFLCVPLVLFYELGILLCALSPRPPLLDLEGSETEELVEV